MQLTIQDDTLCSYSYTRIIYVERITLNTTQHYFITCGYKPLAATAIAQGALHERHSTITLAQLLKLLQKE